ncbi:MAG: hypothetical protein WD873_00295 [Candidatus Hydrogenedentales bacterium]
MHPPMAIVRHLTLTELEAGLDYIRQSPNNGGELQLIVRRPAVDERETVNDAALCVNSGLVGDTWSSRGSSRTEDGAPHPDMQLNIMNARAAALIAETPDRWALAGDQLYVDLDLSGDNLPPGARLEVGAAIIQVTDQPHTGCNKFVARMGRDAMRLVNSPVGRSLNLRGINARVVHSGAIRVGDLLVKL